MGQHVSLKAVMIRKTPSTHFTRKWSLTFMDCF